MTTMAGEYAKEEKGQLGREGGPSGVSLGRVPRREVVKGRLFLKKKSLVLLAFPDWGIMVSRSARYFYLPIIGSFHTEEA